MPLTLSFKLPTNLPPFTRLTFSPLASLSSSAFCSICSFSRLRTQITFSSAVDVETADYGVCVRAGGDVDLDLGVGGCEAGEDGGSEECAMDVSIMRSNMDFF